MPNPSPASDLRAAAAILGAAPDPRAIRVAEGIARYLAEAPEGLDLDRALGVAVPPGGTAWWESEALARRDAALRTIRERHFGSLGITRAAREIARLGRRHEASAGRPDRVPDAAHGLLTEVARNGGFPGLRRVADILRSETVAPTSRF